MAQIELQETLGRIREHEKKVRCPANFGRDIIAEQSARLHASIKHLLDRKLALKRDVRNHFGDFTYGHLFDAAEILKTTEGGLFVTAACADEANRKAETEINNKQSLLCQSDAWFKENNLDKACDLLKRIDTTKAKVWQARVVKHRRLKSAREEMPDQFDAAYFRSRTQEITEVCLGILSPAQAGTRRDEPASTRSEGTGEVDKQIIKLCTWAADWKKDNTIERLTKQNWADGGVLASGSEYYRWQRRFDYAERVIRKLSKSLPCFKNREQICVASIKLLISQEYYENTHQEVLKCRKKYQGNDLILIQAWLAMHDGHFTMAEAYLDALKALDYYNQDAHECMIDMLVTKGDVEGAIAECEKAQKTFPYSARLCLLKGQALRRQKKFDKALAALWESSILEPRLTVTDQVRARVLLDEGRIGESVRSVEEARRRHPNSIGLLGIHGYVRLFGLDDAQGAKRDFEKVEALSAATVAAREARRVSARSQDRPADGRRGGRS